MLTRPEFRKSQFLVLAGCLMFVMPGYSPVSGQVHDEKPIELSGFSLSQAYEISDGRTFDFSDRKLQKLLYRVAKTSRSNFARYSRYTDSVSWQQVFDQTPEFRLHVFDRTGQVIRVDRRQFARATNDDEITGCYVAQCRAETGERFNVVTLAVPVAWKVGETINESIQFQGFLYALVDSPDSTESGSSVVPTFVAKRLAWLPLTPDREQGVGQSHVALARQGVDIGLLDVVRRQNCKRLGHEDSESFFQILSAVGQVGEQELQSGVGFNEIMTQPKEHFGEPVSFQARVKQCVPIQISDEDTKIRLGADHYFQLMVFPDMEGQQIVVKNPGGEDLVYRRFPVTVCARTLPDNLSPADIENTKVFVSGIFFRFWRYQSDLTDSAKTSGQVSPLVISNQPVVLGSGPETLNLILAIFVGTTALVIGIMLWAFRNPNRQRRLENAISKPVDFRGIE